VATIGDILQQGLDPEIAERFRRTRESAQRELAYLLGKRGHLARRVLASVWSATRLEIVVVLSAFYRTVLGPLSAAYEGDFGTALARSTPVAYGNTILIDNDHGRAVRNALGVFELLIMEFGIRSHWLNAGSVSDLLFTIGRDLEQES
jgi:hypothetical protein